MGGVGKVGVGRANSGVVEGDLKIEVVSGVWEVDYEIVGVVTVDGNSDVGEGDLEIDGVGLVNGNSDMLEKEISRLILLEKENSR